MKRVLIIDDDAELATELGDALREEGCAVETAPDGPQGLARLSAQPWQVVLLDFKLPGLSGIEVLARHRGWASNPAVIMISGSLDIDAQLESAGLKQRVTRVFTKPFDFEELLKTVKEIPS
jgi:two-component system, OmpR family, response regulator